MHFGAGGTATVATGASALPEAGALKRPWSYRLGRLAVARFRLCATAVIALTAFNVLWRLPSTVIWSLDEARYGVSASEMLRAHHYLVPTYAGRPEYWNLKPPLGYWLIEASYHLFGRSVLALRLPSALSALAVVWLTMLFCKRHVGRRAAILAGLVVATCYGFFSSHGARSGDLDAELTLLMTAGLLIVPGLNGSAAARLAWGALLGLGFLLKSFAILPFALAATIHLVTASGRPRWSARAWLPATAAFVAMAGTWALLRTLRDGTPYFVERMISEDLLMRASHNIDGAASLPWSYLGGLLDRFAPWPLFLVAYVVQARSSLSQRHLATLRLLLLWALLPMVLFSLARTHHHWYLDPTYPAWAILSALAVLSTFRLVPWRTALCCSTLALLACEARLLGHIALRERRPTNQAFLMSLRSRAAPRQSILSTFRLEYSQRFILQVLDGFAVHEPAYRGGPVPDVPAELVLSRGSAGQLAVARPIQPQ
jgi:4-amino-4-deoxy-L-arabinose transferase-like glycosyltransferase